ncbi:CopG family transcriptional regulator [Glycomyces sp. NPDC046736]|uniref:CopG family transcriptional regulator n=1 Tax=Glycomyces sp. NPDC046736 TaxID=3155615 RepID=UPI0033E58FF2
MQKTTLYLPETLGPEIEAVARSLGVSKAEYMRQTLERAVREDLKNRKPRRRRSYTLLPSGQRRAMTLEEMDDAIYESIKRRVSKR